MAFWPREQIPMELPTWFENLEIRQWFDWKHLQNPFNLGVLWLLSPWAFAFLPSQVVLKKIWRASRRLEMVSSCADQMMLLGMVHLVWLKMMNGWCCDQKFDHARSCRSVRDPCDGQHRHPAARFFQQQLWPGMAAILGYLSKNGSHSHTSYLP